ncbi:helix-turn-helix domain-containing protein [Paenibacillus pinisoli]|uniref:Helix-turn-helix domain-containing protein n=1 Tax=Paenibacillus pinisoli TaxID=1276110 RepID=A0A3A6PM62_9BACL|nr:helix-turn-helix domain-containing protein [Paenibacillus pinisoli]RJX41460.1 helix-turn-helix domain-containing protein [Paenibacillus pinisoli]
MYKAIVVDDENFDLEGMRQLIPWTELGIEVLRWENKPLAAWSFIEGNHLDILITDIKMPIMSGLELAKLAQQKNNRVKKVFISGYQDFDYAKQALDMKADAYLLKPLDDDELIDILRRVVAELDAMKEEEASGMDSFEFIRNDVVLHLLEGDMDEQTLHTFLQKYSVNIPQTAAAAVLIEVDRVLPSRYSERDHAILLDHTLELIMNYIDKRNLGLYCKVSDARIGLIYTASESGMTGELNRMIDGVRSGGPLTATVSFGDPVTDRSSLVASFGQARELIGFKMFLGRDRLILPGEAKWNEAKEVRDVNSILDQMFTATVNYQLVRICDCMEELFQLVKTFEKPIRVYHFSLHIVMKLEHYLEGMNESFNSLLGWSNDYFDTINQFETAHDIQSWLQRTLFEISEILYTRKQSRNNRLFDEITGYVKEHLSEEITLKEMANHFAYSPNHLGHMFKVTMGVSFNEYMAMCRMEKAKELLRNHKLKVYEVADQVGYKSLTYFSRAFREYAGMTPGDYRKQGGLA